MSKQVLMNTQDIRRLKGAVFRSWPVELKHRVAKGYLRGHEECLKETKGKKGHGMGPPQWHTFPCIVKVCSEAAAPDSPERKVLEEHRDRFTEAKCYRNIVTTCRLGAHFQSTHKKLEIPYRGDFMTPVIDAISSVLAAEGFEEYEGQANAGGIEREMEELMGMREPTVGG